MVIFVSGDFSFGRSGGGDGGYDVFLCLLLFMIVKSHIWWQLWWCYRVNVVLEFAELADLEE